MGRDGLQEWPGNCQGIKQIQLVYMRLGGTKSALREEDYILSQKRKRKSSIGNRFFCTSQNTINS